MLYKHITELIGNTPLLEIDPKVHGLKNIDLYAKLEYFNPFGSVKDRIAWGMVKEDIEKISKNKMKIIEASSGNTAKALQVISSVFGVDFKTFTNRTKVEEVKSVLTLLGAEIEEFPQVSECLDPTIPNNVFQTIDKLVKEHPEKYYHPSQYTNQKNIDTHYEATGKEIFNDIGKVDFFFGGLGTTGSTRGTATFLKEKNPNLKTIGIVSTKGDFIPGIRSANEMWEVGLFEKEFYSEIVQVMPTIALDATLELVKKCGILAGPTSGAAYAGALEYLKRTDLNLKTRQKAVFIACDRVEWYVSYFKARRPELFGLKALPKETTISEEELEKVESIDPKKIKKWAGTQPSVILDVRSNSAFNSEHIPGSINIPSSDLKDMISTTLPFSKDTPILVVCSMGETSRKMAALLTQKGFKTINLAGGIRAWMSHNQKE